MYSPLQNTMLCVNCFRDAPNEIRSQCQDIETAYSQASKRLEKGQNSIMDLQVRKQINISSLVLLHFRLLFMRFSFVLDSSRARCSSGFVEFSKRRNNRTEGSNG